MNVWLKVALFSVVLMVSFAVAVKLTPVPSEVAEHAERLTKMTRGHKSIVMAYLSASKKDLKAPFATQSEWLLPAYLQHLKLNWHKVPMMCCNGAGSYNTLIHLS
ncbi:MAG: hypothetical protein HOM11_03255 [Methylococcales bacterium]|jgi:hypothetical protein|nr:hypothetical protein [Methylococcales bacterium]MBT7443263.1 hypothetical protein [Methylococcales bacterium]